MIKKDFHFKGIHFSADQLNTASTVANNSWNKMVNWAMQGHSNPIIPSINVVDSMTEDL